MSPVCQLTISIFVQFFQTVYLLSFAYYYLKLLENVFAKLLWHDKLIGLFFWLKISKSLLYNLNISHYLFENIVFQKLFKVKISCFFYHNNALSEKKSNFRSGWINFILYDSYRFSICNLLGTVGSIFYIMLTSPEQNSMV